MLRAALLDRPAPARQATGIPAEEQQGYAEMSGRALRLIREEPDQVLRLEAFRVARPEVIIGDGGFGCGRPASIADGERVISRHTLRGLLDKLDELIGSIETSWTRARIETRRLRP